MFPGGGRADRRGQADEEDDVGAVLELAPALLQVPLHRVQGEEELTSFNFATNS